MNLNLSNWKPFQVGSIFTILNGKGITQEEIADNEGDFIAVQSGEDNNGVMGKISLDYCKQMQYTFSEKPCLTVARSGSAGFVSFQIHGCVVGDSAKILLLPDKVATEEVYTFLQSILTANRFKYTYGRKVTKEKYLNEWLDLPVKHNSDGTILIDETHKYSGEGFIPDWQFMEDYIKSLHHKPLTTKNKPGQAPELNVQDWGEFDLADLFGDCERGTRITTDDRTDGNIPFCTAGEFNEGISELIGNPEAKIYKKALSIDMFGNCFYHGYDFKCDDNILVITNKHINEYTGLFLSQVISADKYRNNYGRQYRQKDYVKHKIKLPIDADGNPDWQFMEDYIKALPYGDRLEG